MTSATAAACGATVIRFLSPHGSSIRFDHDPPFVEHPDGSVTGWESDDFGVDINDGGGIWGDGG